MVDYAITIRLYLIVYVSTWRDDLDSFAEPLSPCWYSCSLLAVGLGHGMYRETIQYLLTWSNGKIKIWSDPICCVMASHGQYISSKFTLDLDPLVVCSTDRSKAVVPVLVLLCCFVVYSTRRFVVCLSVWHFVLVFFSPFSIAITSLGEKRANLSAFRTFVRFVLV